MPGFWITGQSETSDVLLDTLCLGDEVCRSRTANHPRYRLPPNAAKNRVRKGTQRAARAALAQALERTEAVLERVPTEPLSVPRQDAHDDLRRHVDSESHQAIGRQSGHQETRLSAHSQALLRHGAARSRSGSADDQQTVGPRQLRHNDGLSALSPGASGLGTQSAGLAAREATAHLSTSGRESTPQSSGTFELGSTAFDPEEIEASRVFCPTTRKQAETDDQTSSQSQQVGLSVHDILCRGIADYVQHYRDGEASFQVQSVLAKINLCRTSALGERWYECDDCGELTKLYNSCGDRHCPGCSGSKRANWSDKVSQLLLPAVDYYQVIFTLPSVQDGSWKAAAPPPVDAELAKRMPEKYLVDAINLRRRFRKFAIAALRKLRDAGELRYGGSLAYLADESAWSSLVAELEEVEWVSHIEAPQGESSDPQHVVRYLTRYLTGGPIGNSRIISADDAKVTFMARTGEKVGGERKQEPYTLQLREFVRRWCLHIQPQQLTKTRFFGGWSPSKHAKYRQRCEAALKAAGLWHEPATMQPVASKSAATRADEPQMCSHCGSDQLRLV